MDTSSQTYLNETLTHSPSPKCNSGKLPIKSDAGYEVKLDFQEQWRREIKKQHGSVHYI